MEPKTEDSMLAKRSRLKPLLLVEQVRSRAERERGSSSESAHSIGPSIGARLFHSDSIRGINNVIALPVSSTLPTPPGTPKPFQLSPEIEDLEQARTPVLQYHLPFRYIASKAPVLDCNQSLHGIVLGTSYLSNQSMLAEAVHHVEPKIASIPTLNPDTITISGAGSNTRQGADHRKGAARRTSPPQILKTTNHQLSQLNSSTSFTSTSVPRTESTFSCSSCSSDTSALSPIGSSRQSYPIRRRSSFSRSISCDSRGSYGTFGGQELAKLNQSRGESVLDRASVAELSEEESDGLCNADSTPKITQQAPTMHKFPTSHSATIPLTCTSIMLPAVPIQSKLGNGVILTDPRPLALKPTPPDFASRERNPAGFALSAYPFPISVPLSRPPNAPESLDALSIKETPTRIRVLSTPATLRPHEASTRRRVPTLSSASQTELRRVVLPQSPFVYRIDPTRLLFKTTPTSTPLQGSPIINTIAPSVPAQVTVRYDSVSTVDGPTTACSPNVAGNKPSKLRRVTSLLGRIFERRPSRSNL